MPRKKKVILIDTEEKLIKHFGNPYPKTKRDRLVNLLLKNQLEFLKKLKKMPRAEAEKLLRQSISPRQSWFTPVDPRKLFPAQELPAGALPDYTKRLKRKRK